MSNMFTISSSTNISGNFRTLQWRYTVHPRNRPYIGRRSVVDTSNESVPEIAIDTEKVASIIIMNPQTTHQPSLIDQPSLIGFIHCNPCIVLVQIHISFGHLLGMTGYKWGYSIL